MHELNHLISCEPFTYPTLPCPLHRSLTQSPLNASRSDNKFCIPLQNSSIRVSSPIAHGKLKNCLRNQTSNYRKQHPRELMRLAFRGGNVRRMSSKSVHLLPQNAHEFGVVRNDGKRKKFAGKRIEMHLGKDTHRSDVPEVEGTIYTKHDTSTLDTSICFHATICSRTSPSTSISCVQPASSKQDIHILSSRSWKLRYHELT